MRINSLGAAVHAAVPSYDLSKVKLFIAIPTRGTASISFSESLAVSCCALTLAKVDVSIYYHQANNFVDMSRNKLLAKFMQSDCTHIWFIDDDMGWNPDAILKMLTTDKDFLAGIGPLKTDSGEDFACHLFSNPDGTTVIEPGPHYLMSAQYVGGAFLLLKRRTVQKMMDAHPELRSEAVDPDQGYHLFQSLYKPIWKTEDYVFCDRWRELGGEIWCFPDISFTHQGTKDWAGNYFNFRVERAKKEAAEPADFISKASQAAFEKSGVSESLKRLLNQSYVERVVKSVTHISDNPAVMQALEAARVKP